MIGRMQLGAKTSIEDLTKTLSEIPKLKNIPIIVNLDFGHTRPLFTIPIGGLCEINDGSIIFKS